MIYSLNGKLIYKDNAVAVIECGGVGYKCNVSLKTAALLPNVGSEVFLYTYMKVSEDDVSLFGFKTVEEHDIFKLLLSVSGAGAIKVMSILSDYTPDQIYLFIASGDSKSLSAPKGIGAKLASKIVLELKDKIGGISSNKQEILQVSAATAEGSPTKDAIEALTSLGFSYSEASVAVSKCDASLSTDEIIKKALASLSRRL